MKDDKNRDRRRRNYDLGRTAPFGGEVLRQKNTVSNTEDRFSRQSRSGRRRLLLQLLITVMIASSLWYLLTPIRTVQLEASNHDDVAQAALAVSLDQHSHRNLLIDTDKLARDVTAAIPDAVTTEVNHNLLLSRLKITVVTQQPAVLWQSRGVQYVVSDYGVALSQATDAHQNLPLIFDDANLLVEEKSQIAPRDFIAFVGALEKAATERSLVLKERYVSGSTRELRLVLEDRAYNVTVSTQRSETSQLDELLRLEAHFKQTGQAASQYVDLRIPGRAFWR